MLQTSISVLSVDNCNYRINRKGASYYLELSEEAGRETGDIFTACKSLLKIASMGKAGARIRKFIKAVV